jgi:hypothetical protein
VGPQIGEVVGRIAPAQHVEHPLEGGAWQVREGRGAAHTREQLIDGERLDGGHRDDLLRQDVERVARIERLLDLACAHARRRRRARDEVLGVLGEQDAVGHAADAVARAPHPLQARGDAGRRFDLDDQVDRAHVDAQLQRRRRDDRGQSAGLQALLDGGALLARERAVMSERHLLAREVVHGRRQALGEAPAVDEDDGRTVRAHEVDEARVDVGPDASARRVLLGVDVARGRLLRGGGGVDALHREPELLSRAGVHDRHRARSARVESAEQPPHLVERALRRAQADALERWSGCVPQRLEPLDGERQMGPALARDEGVDLVDDEDLDGGERLARGRREHEVERLGRRDEDVGGGSRHPCALSGRRVARAHVHGGCVRRVAAAERPRGDPGDGHAEVPFDVHGERLEGRDVQHARPGARGRRGPIPGLRAGHAAPGGAWRRLAYETVDGDEERGQRLARAGRREQERRLPTRDGRPPQRLRSRRLAEARAEPLGDRRMERSERRGHRGHEEKSVGRPANARTRTPWRRCARRSTGSSAAAAVAWPITR